MKRVDNFLDAVNAVATELWSWTALRRKKNTVCKGAALRGQALGRRRGMCGVRQMCGETQERMPVPLVSPRARMVRTVSIAHELFREATAKRSAATTPRRPPLRHSRAAATPMMTPLTDWLSISSAQLPTGTPIDGPRHLCEMAKFGRQSILLRLLDSLGA